MDIALLATSMPSWLLFLVTFAIGIMAAELGAWVARKREKASGADNATPVGSLIGATLGLLAFMLGFTFSIAADRFNDRKRLMVEEARAIGTCYLRTSLIPEKQKKEAGRLIGDYVDLLIGLSTSEDRSGRITRIEMLGMQIWQQAASLKDETMDPPIRSLFISSVNEMVDLFAERKTVVLTFRIPGAIWFVLFLLYLLNLFLVGAEVSKNKGRRHFNVPIMAAAFALIVMLIASMDETTREGQFTVKRQALLDVQKMIHEENAKLQTR